MVIIRRNDLFRPKKKSQSDREKFNANKQSSTEKRVDRVERVEKSTQSTQSTQTSVDNRSKTNNNLQNYEIIVKDENVGTKVYARVEKVGEKTKVDHDRVIVTPILKIALKYKDKTWECNADVVRIEGKLTTIGCEKTLNEVAKATGRHPPKARIVDAIDEYVDSHFDIESTPLVDYVKEKYADRR